MLSQSLLSVSFALSSSGRVTKILWQSCKCTSLIGKPYDIARKFNDYSPRQYKVHLQIICLQKLPSLFLKPLVSRSVHSLSAGVLFPWLLFNHYLSICDRLVHIGFDFDLSDQFSFAHFYLFTMGIWRESFCWSDWDQFKRAYSFLWTLLTWTFETQRNFLPVFNIFCFLRDKVWFWRVLNEVT